MFLPSAKIQVNTIFGKFLLHLLLQSLTSFIQKQTWEQQSLFWLKWILHPEPQCSLPQLHLTPCSCSSFSMTPRSSFLMLPYRELILHQLLIQEIPQKSASTIPQWLPSVLSPLWICFSLLTCNNYIISFLVFPVFPIIIIITTYQWCTIYQELYLTFSN